MRSEFPVAVHLFFIKGDRILLLRRFNTGWRDGMYSVPAGHLEVGETITQAAVREAREEVGVNLVPEQLEIVHVMHRKEDDERIDYFMVVRTWQDEIVNKEPEKCDDLSWFPLNALPENSIPYVEKALENFQNQIMFSEFGW